MKPLPKEPILNFPVLKEDWPLQKLMIKQHKPLKLVPHIGCLQIWRRQALSTLGSCSKEKDE